MGSLPPFKNHIPVMIPELLGFLPVTISSTDSTHKMKTISPINNQLFAIVSCFNAIS